MFLRLIFYLKNDFFSGGLCEHHGTTLMKSLNSVIDTDIAFLVKIYEIHESWSHHNEYIIFFNLWT